ncbi:TolC family outer membrane protein [Oleiagrimonas sp.]|jgi:outer membrane protein|uniref:TolC family outer membrane protein n=1 Tax=Oleiagrimonas sp. TaxID=2010330 RepID=UPI00262B9499|nr:TolC family outer membrane protein [Oleiagrimonas sp.]MDA3914168.1 TolC family outer membrane protein [Oleiagrimonas sp.]
MKYPMHLKTLFLAMTLAATPILAHGEDLMQAYSDALANDPQLALANANRMSVHEGISQSRAALLPQVDGSLSLTQDNRGRSNGSYVDPNTGRIFVTPATGYLRTRNISATLTQSIFNFSSYENLKAAHEQYDSQDAQYKAAEQNLMIRVATAYFNVLTAKDQVEFSKANEKSLARELDQARQRFKVGLSAITDVQDAKAQHDAARASLIRAKNVLDDAREALVQITDKPATDLKTLRQDLPLNPPTPNDSRAWVKTALDNNPSIQAQIYNVDAADSQINSARGGHLPTLSASLSYGKSSNWSQNHDFNNSQPSDTTIGLTLRIPIFSGGLTQSKVRQSIYQRNAAQDGLKSQRRQTIRDTRNYYRSVIAGISEVQATRQAVESNKSALEATEAGFKVGTRTIVDVLISQQNLTNAKQSYSQARHQFVLNKLLLKQAAGTITVKDLQHVNALLQ